VILRDFDHGTPDVRTERRGEHHAQRAAAGRQRSTVEIARGPRSFPLPRLRPRRSPCPSHRRQHSPPEDGAGDGGARTPSLVPPFETRARCVAADGDAPSMGKISVPFTCTASPEGEPPSVPSRHLTRIGEPAGWCPSARSPLPTGSQRSVAGGSRKANRSARRLPESVVPAPMARRHPSPVGPRAATRRAGGRNGCGPDGRRRRCGGGRRRGDRDPGVAGRESPAPGRPGPGGGSGDWRTGAGAAAPCPPRVDAAPAPAPMPGSGREAARNPLVAVDLCRCSRDADGGRTPARPRVRRSAWRAIR
jgi:hypothetical protein